MCDNQVKSYMLKIVFVGPAGSDLVEKTMPT